MATPALQKDSSRPYMDTYKQAIILCAGNAGRMKPLSYYLHKSMMPLRDGRPVIDHIVDYLFSYGFEPIIALSQGNHANQIVRHLGPKFEYSITDHPQGTAGEVYAARNLLRKNGPFLVYYGDTLTDLNLHKLLAMHRADNIATITGFRGMRSEYGVIHNTGTGTVHQIEEKPETDTIINLPVFWCDPKIISYCKSPIENMPYDFFSQLFPFLLEEGHRIGLYVHRGQYKDVGKLVDYAQEAGLE